MPEIPDQATEPQSRKRTLDTDADEARLDELPRKKARASPPVSPAKEYSSENQEIEEDEDIDDESSVLEESSDVSTSESDMSSLELAGMKDDNGRRRDKELGNFSSNDGDYDEENEEDDDLSEENVHNTLPAEDKGTASSLRARVRDFLAWMKGANKNLDPTAESGIEIVHQDDVDEEQEEIRLKKHTDNDEDENDGKPYIEMNVGLGVLEERNEGDTDSDDQSTSGDEEDAMHTLLGRKAQKGGVQEVDTD